MSYYVMTVRDKLGRKFEQVIVADSADEARLKLQCLCGPALIVGEAAEYFGGNPPNTTPFAAEREGGEP